MPGHAKAISFDLHSSSATVIKGETTSKFYQVEPGDAASGSGGLADSSGEDGSAKKYYSYSYGGTKNTGYHVTFNFGLNPQPLLTSAFLRASDYYLSWDAADLAGFNSGKYDSLTVWNDSLTYGIKGERGYAKTELAGILGSLGGVVPPTGGGGKDDDHQSGGSSGGTTGPTSQGGGAAVPDAASTMTLLGAGLAAVGMLRRKFLA